MMLIILEMPRLHLGLEPTSNQEAQAAAAASCWVLHNTLTIREETPHKQNSGKFYALFFLPTEFQNNRIQAEMQ